MISATVIQKTRSDKWCEFCQKKIQIGGSAIRCYGAGAEGDPPYVVFLHPECLHCENTKAKLGKGKK